MGFVKRLIEVIKKKPFHILGGSIVITFLVVKIIDVLLNWHISNSIGNSAITYVASIGGYSPIIFAIVVVLFSMFFKRNINIVQDCDDSHASKRPAYYDNYVWKDIFKDRLFFALFAVIAFFLFMVLQFTIVWISQLSDNYAISSMQNIPQILILVVAIFLAMKIALLIQNVFLAWLLRTENGNRLASKIVFAMGILTAIVMSGIDSLWDNPEAGSDEFIMEHILGEVIPIDIGTTVFAIATLFLWYKVKQCSWGEKKFLNRGFWLAIGSFVISCTPLATGIQYIWILLGNAFK
ncbi:MAG: hypothetical protein IJD24_05040 [Agathobacter sp.]|nr:hypothetical protein [Agathobacter sp.]